MSSAKITLLGFYNWMNDAGDDLFKAFDDLPAGVDKDDLVSNILLRGGEFEVLYSDPVFMQAAIGPWLRKWQHTIEKWVTALSIKYDPLYNYDRTEEWTDDRVDSRIHSRTNDSSESLDRIMNESTGKSGTTSTEGNSTTADNTSQHGIENETHSGSIVTENETSAFDSSTYSPKDKSTATDTTGIGTTNDQMTVSAGNSKDDTKTDYSEQSGALQQGNESRKVSGSDQEVSSGQDGLVHKGHLYGNIGVTTSQQMLRDELEVARFNLIDEITDLFLPEFIIPVYY